VLDGIEGSEQPTGIPPPNRFLEVTIVCIEKIKLKDIVLLATAHTQKSSNRFHFYVKMEGGFSAEDTGCTLEKNWQGDTQMAGLLQKL
jgi:hypothetical protein